MKTFVPKFALDSNAAAVIVGVFGTTISPYLFFWQANMEVESAKQNAHHVVVDKKLMRDMNEDVDFGMFFSKGRR